MMPNMHTPHLVSSLSRRNSARSLTGKSTSTGPMMSTSAASSLGSSLTRDPSTDEACLRVDRMVQAIQRQLRQELGFKEVVVATGEEADESTTNAGLRASMLGTSASSSTSTTGYSRSRHLSLSSSTDEGMGDDLAKMRLAYQQTMQLGGSSSDNSRASGSSSTSSSTTTTTAPNASGASATPACSDCARGTVYVSPQYASKSRLLVIVPYREAGVWSRSICMHQRSAKDSTGSMLGYLRKAMAEGYGVIIMNPAAQPCHPRRHVQQAWDQLVVPLAEPENTGRDVFILAYSRGAQLVQHLLEYDNGQGVVQDRVKALALVEPSHYVSPRDSYFTRRILARRAVAWLLSSDLDVGCKLPRAEARHGCVCISAGAMPAAASFLGLSPRGGSSDGTGGENGSSLEDAGGGGVGGQGGLSGSSSGAWALEVVQTAVFGSFAARVGEAAGVTINDARISSCGICHRKLSLLNRRIPCSWCEVKYCSRCCEDKAVPAFGAWRVCAMCQALPCLIDPRRQPIEVVPNPSDLKKKKKKKKDASSAQTKTKKAQKPKLTREMLRSHHVKKVHAPPHRSPRAKGADEQTIGRDSIFIQPDPNESVVLTDFEIIKLIGRGACGRVKLVRKSHGTDEGSFYAMKAIRKKLVISRGLVEATNAERRILDRITHPYVATLKYAFQTDAKLYLLSVYYPGGNLLDQMRLARRFPEDRTRLYAAEVALALHHLHQHDIIYRDLKLENVLVGSDGHVALTDFGMSKEDMPEDGRTSTFVGTYQMMAPEVFTGRTYSRLVDWWALGVMVYEMIDGRTPFNAKTNKLIKERITTVDLKFSPRFTADAKDFVSRLLTREEGDRLGAGPCGFEHIQQHPWFHGLNWDRVARKEERYEGQEELRKAHAKEFVTQDIFDTYMNTLEVPIDTPVSVKSDADGDLFQDFEFNFIDVAEAEAQAEKEAEAEKEEGVFELEEDEFSENPVNEDNEETVERVQAPADSQFDISLLRPAQATDFEDSAVSSLSSEESTATGHADHDDDNEDVAAVADNLVSSKRTAPATDELSEDEHDFGEEEEEPVAEPVKVATETPLSPSDDVPTSAIHEFKTDGSVAHAVPAGGRS